jgi:hypothetical protein
MPRNNPIKGGPNPLDDSANITLSQKVSNPVGSKENTDEGMEKWNPPMDLNESYPVVFNQQVVNPVGCEKNTDKGAYQEPLPMRPIPS